MENKFHQRKKNQRISSSNSLITKYSHALLISEIEKKKIINKWLAPLSYKEYHKWRNKIKRKNSTKHVSNECLHILSK